MTISAEVSERFRLAKNRLVVQASDLSLGSIAEMVQGGGIDIAPRYQRRERWDRAKQSALIESFLLNIPVPPIYLAEEESGTYSIVDGKQRVTAIWLFMNDRLELTSLEDFEEIEGMKFSDMPAEIQNTLKIRPYLRVITLLNQSDPKLKYEVFIRLNTGGDAMTPQEIRNVAYQGPMNDAIYELAQDTFLRQQLKITSDNRSPIYRTMQDAEIVLRFFALMDGWQKFSGDYRREMDLFMASSEWLSKKAIDDHKQRFRRALHACQSIWEEKAFRRPDNDLWRDQFLNGLYDAQMIAVDSLDDREIQAAVRNRDDIVEKTRNLFNDTKFDISVRQGTNNPEKIRTRINGIISILQ
ncbi:DUF262 domain-containing protein [Deinococcus ficus]|uniref:DUF262 domain-containing protein n=1 Tax=Deinococcus ficus TaxID=317577 RepID=UPI0018FF09A6|nr:DUF262 domain-containing protein [Deinococcus ficus]